MSYLRLSFTLPSVPICYPCMPESAVAQETRSHTSIKPAPRLRHNIAWSLLGNVVYASSQWAVLATASKLGGPQMVGQLALGLAIASPVYLFTNLQLSAVQATDTLKRFAFPQYLALRFASTGFAITLIFLILQLWPQRPQTTAVCLIIASWKAVDSISDIIYGFAQKHERMDLITTSQIVKGITAVVAFTAVLILIPSVTWATAALALAGCTTLAGYDLSVLKRTSRVAMRGSAVEITPHWSTQDVISMIGLTFPLGLSAMLISFNANIPRYFIGHVLGEESLGFFAATAFITMAGTFVVSAAGQAVLPRLARYHEAGDLASFKAVLIRLSALALGVGIAGIFVSCLFGRELLSNVYRPEYGRFSTLLTLMMCTATVGYEASVLNFAMNGMRRFRMQLPLFIATNVTCILACAFLLPIHGLNGAALATGAAYGVQLLGAAVIVAHGLRNPATR